VILVAGATGNIGREVVHVLLSAGEPVHALSRNPGQATLPHGAEPVAGDLNRPETLRDAFRGASAMFLLAGYENLPELLADAADTGVERVVLLSGGAATASDTNNVVSQYQLTSERALRDSRLAWTILRPYEFMSNALAWAPQLRAGNVVRAPFAEVPVAVIDPYDIAAVAALALRSDAHHGQIYRLSGPETLRPADRVRILGGVLGRRLQPEPQSNEQTRLQMSTAMPAEYVDAFFSFYVDHTINESEPLPTVGELTGSPPRTFQEWATTHASAFA
jgi:uncharacterized protein YbjT (DUF2867 family)